MAYRAFKKHTDLENKKILDWGCGPARIVRHLSDLLKNCEIFGTDYNKKSIKWCQKNINNVFFTSNELSPPLSYEDNYFDIVYAISIFTHLSADMHYKWINEVFRILKKGGIFFFTSHGIIFKQKLSLNEQYDFDEGNVVIKANTKEGHRSYGAFHPPVFIRSLIKDFILLEHIEGQNIDTRLQQDIRIIKK